MPRRIYIANFGFLAAAMVWTLGWILTLVVAIERIAQRHDPASIAALLLSILFCLVRLRVMVRGFRRVAPTQPPAPSEPERWPRRIVGWITAAGWSFVAIMWNLGIVGTELRMAHDGRGWFMLILIPWSLIGWFLLLVLFVGVGVMIDWLIGLVFKA